MTPGAPASSGFFFKHEARSLTGRRRYIIKIAAKSYVSLEYRLSLESGEEIESSEAAGEPLGFIAGADQVIPGLEKALMGMAVGDSSKIVVAPEDAYGDSDPELIQEVPKEAFPDDADIAPGMSFEADGPEGPFLVNVVKTADDGTVTVDLNHPLAGKTLIFDIKIIEVREATEAELSDAENGCDCGCGCQSSDDAGCGCNEGSNGLPMA